MNGLFYNILKTIWLFPILFALLASCNGQTATQGRSNESAPRQLITEETPKQEYKDPLFFIEGQLCQHLRKIFQDSQGNLWFGTNVYDLMRYDGDSLEYITKAEGFSGGRITGIVEDAEGNIWFATAFGLNKFNGKSFTIFTEENGLPNNEIWSLLIDSKGIFWVGHNEGLCRFDGNEFENIPITKPQVGETNTIYSEDRITAIVEDKDGNLWLGTDGYGICKYAGGTLIHFTTGDGLPGNAIHDLLLDSKGRLWIGTYWGGLSEFDGKTFINHTQNGDISGVEVGAFFEDDNGDIWFGVENNGVYKYNGASFSHYHKESGLDGSILNIYKDRENRFWFGGWGGLFRFDGESFSSVTKDGPWD